MGLMDGLSGWLRQIIAVLLLASIIDLLLPNRTMQRYVRLVAGLFVLLTVATPVLNWMKGDFAGKLAEGMDAVVKSPQGAPDQLATIEAEGERLRGKQSQQAANLVSVRLAAAIRSDIELGEERAVRSVDVRTAQGKDGNWAITGVKVVLEGEDGGEAGAPRGSIAAMSDIDPIADVDIRVEIGGERGLGRESGGEDEALQATVEENRLDRETENRVVSLVSNKFGIASGLIEVSQISDSRPAASTGKARR
ncbi:stage III sporulation protein AF [Cohnella panacarvi]|uniref:stage III sporulation protein AF n=1 Tax=Cohnella panacarvi TaxID=400776 RepID=UPI00047DB13D|nr:stage III sporulation protein AF [Cohnella panacarvi]